MKMLLLIKCSLKNPNPLLHQFNFIYRALFTFLGARRFLVSDYWSPLAQKQGWYSFIGTRSEIFLVIDSIFTKFSIKHVFGFLLFNLVHKITFEVKKCNSELDQLTSWYLRSYIVTDKANCRGIPYFLNVLKYLNISF